LVTDPVQVALIVAEALETCLVRYLVGGSLASAVGGEPRSTLDVDLVVELTENDIEPLVVALGDRFHVDADSLRRAVRERSSANIIHYETSTKVDLFIAGGTPLDRLQMDRRQRVRVSTNPERWLHVYTPEDIVLQKLRWYRMGNEASDRQWRDILGVILVQGERLDHAYLQDNADAFGVSDLLQRALSESQVD
jgi:hypothetical protein